MTDSEQLVNNIVEGIQDRKGKSIVIINLSETDNSICDYYVICNGDSTTHVNAVADSVVRYVLETSKERPSAKDGFENAQWIALDYGNVMVHVFQQETREFYNLEDLWADGKFIHIDDLD